jgi:hypothetical protein
MAFLSEYNPPQFVLREQKMNCNSVAHDCQTTRQRVALVSFLFCSIDRFEASYC